MGATGIDPFMAPLAECQRIHEVQIARLDDLCADAGVQGPYGLKIDTEGYELEVLHGAPRVLAETQFVILEATIAGRFEGGYLFVDLIAFMDESNFDLFDVLTVRHVPRLAQALYADCMFVRRDLLSPVAT